jgi:uncharacterized protein (DUF488 family)
MLFTIGHSTHNIETFLSLLSKNGVTAIADVRSSPYSRFSPQFKQENLKQSLRQANVAYTFLGKELGARSENPACYIAGRVQYNLLAQQQAFADGVARIKEGMTRYSIALMCAEKDPIECHRALLVAKSFHQSGISVSHIHADGSLEGHDIFESRLLAICKFPEGDMFRSRSDFLREAYIKQGDRVAYQDEEMLNAEDSSL